MIQNNDSFLNFGLNIPIIKALNDMKYIQPSPIQKLCIPYLLLGKDVLGMAQTGSGKTAAFALPLLNNITINLKRPQILVLTPTRELAVQVAKAFVSFSKYMVHVKVLALYGGQRYDIQLKILRTGPQVIVGTPGRLLDHLKRSTLNLSHLRSLVLDEADEMLRMGFIEDVENIMLNIPKKHQTALFSATMPKAIKNIARKFMVLPKEIKIKSSITTQPNIKQSYWIVRGKKTDGLIRFLELEDSSATIIFVRTKSATLEIAEVLERFGYNSSALNGDMNQNLREKTLERLKDGRLDILIATDVAARGLDVERINLVINYDIPMDVESYVHRIGRTGRAGRMGRALLFVEHHERRLLKNIERYIKQPILQVELPNIKLLSQYRINKFYKKLLIELESKDLDQYCTLLKKWSIDNKYDIYMLSAALLKIAQGGRPLFFKINNSVNCRSSIKNHKKKIITSSFRGNKIKDNMYLYRIEVGHHDGVEVRHIVGAIANEGRISSYKIGNVKIYLKYSTVELSSSLSKDVFKHLLHTRVLNKPMKITLFQHKK
ncbi:DEAD/DEAH box helicase [Buchnera aphidicola]|uniref:ATP-dependent RNA helicase DeaD n=1 Tax=Buchnera aphidicola (Sarucallis kahawaluokalani) TaxID=1241878 RepID=A0A4D6Y9H7_9GAMM|nr:DEAD/DEAH box helicase [Buchnera aphidicola]QCI26039.1 DEAD/DEAH box helicase [Buchnera aphidicola (Sarucallis kahawaluokalani)]